MKHLGELKIDGDGGWLENALSSKKENVNGLNIIADKIREKYKKYDDIIENHESSLDESEFLLSKDLLVDFYSSPPSNLKELIKCRRNDHGLNECPYCGFPFSPDTLDHFIPKDLWPEYSIYVNNLVPQCRECAPIKGERYYCDDTTMARFVHPIYSSIMSKIFFKITVEFDDQMLAPNFNVSFLKNPSLTSPEALRAKKHLNELQVKTRIMVYCRREFNGWKNKLKARKFDIRDALQQRINENQGGDNSAGNWNIALYRGILENEQITTYLNSLCPAQNENFIKTKFVEIDI